ncbi:hypothetical protein FHETE_3578 [Fusarium heterosporum]|uniref:Glycine-rich cell wall structural protein 1 n=1 Tax=Fusarium heterosporum TaxID=42747 RepID=A0A8H5TPD7_FUSHE|nr:hypothetical protein FHETE_3578 [Fusarium heterosporum]
METINNLTAAATKAVWGETETGKKEPVSGVQGDTARGEPYDAGNLETPLQEKAAHDYGRHGEERTAAPEHTTSLGREEPVSKPTENTNTTTDITTPISAPAPAPNHAKDTSAGQNDTRTPEQADKGNKDLQDVDDSSEGTDVKLGEGPGPRPIEKLAKEYGGDAGNAPVEGTSHAPGTEVGSEATADSSKKENAPHDPKEDEYITASGFKADGGDFDASKPGAGQEADRLMEEKGIHLGGKGESDPSHTESHSSSKHHSSHDDKADKKDKPSLGERIKAKLHKH